MPYKIIPSKGGYFVIDNSGLKLEKKPLKTLKQAQKQRIAVYLSKKRKGENIKNFFI